MMQTMMAGAVGLAAGVWLAKLYLTTKLEDNATDAYEEGWADGYQVGLNAPRPKRVKKITKATAPIEHKKKDEVTHQLPESSIANASLAIAEYAVIHEMLSHDDNDDDFDDGDDE